jgi:hypothetical protein
MEQKLACETKELGENLFQCEFVLQNSHLTLTAVKVESWQLRRITAFLFLSSYFQATFFSSVSP